MTYFFVRSRQHSIARTRAALALATWLATAALVGCASASGNGEAGAEVDVTPTDARSNIDSALGDVGIVDDAARAVVDAVDVASEPAIPPGAPGGECPDLTNHGIPGTVCAETCPPGLGWSELHVDSPFCPSGGRCCAPCHYALQPDGECVDPINLGCRRGGGRCGENAFSSNPCPPGQTASATLFCSFGSAPFACCMPSRPDASVDAVEPDAGPDATGADEGAVDAASCTCAAGLASCGEGCFDLRSAPSNCGRCGLACASTEACVDGRCVAKNERGEVLCAGRMVDVRSNPEHCGGCGRACCAGTLCSAGECVVACSPPSIACRAACARDGCGYSCVNTRVDAQNCGACGARCSAGQRCVDGRCM